MRPLSSAAKKATKLIVNITRAIPTILLVALVIIANCSVLAPQVEAAPDGSLLWTQTNNPTAKYDEAQGVAVDSSGVYIAGYDNSSGNMEWRIEKRGLTDGELTPSFGAGGVIQENPSPGYDEAYGVAVDSTGIYAIGYDNSPGGSDTQWRIEKRSLTDGSLIGAFGTGGVVTNNPSPGFEVAYGVTVDSSGIYTVGEDNSPGGSDTQWRIEKRNLVLPVSKLVITVYPSSVTAASWSTKYTVQRQDHNGNPVTSGSTTVNLASTSTGTDKKFAETAWRGLGYPSSHPRWEQHKGFLLL